MGSRWKKHEDVLATSRGFAENCAFMQKSALDSREFGMPKHYSVNCSGLRFAPVAFGISAICFGSV